jgi:hypothetical protein
MVSARQASFVAVVMLSVLGAAIQVEPFLIAIEMKNAVGIHAFLLLELSQGAAEADSE